jgi:hypothetical protein
VGSQIKLVWVPKDVPGNLKNWAPILEIRTKIQCRLEFVNSKDKPKDQATDTL